MPELPSLLQTAATYGTRLGLIAGVGIAGLCLLGGLNLFLDELNHFQSFWLAASLGTLLLAWIAGNPLALRGAAVLAALNAILFLAPVLRLPTIGMPVVAAPAAGQADAVRSLKIMTFNIYLYNTTPEKVAALILAEAPDIVVLQEVTSWHVDLLNRLLRDQYPWRSFCSTDGRCDGALLSKLPWLGVRQIERGYAVPPGVTARFDLGNGRHLRMVGVHLWNPKAPRRQLREIEWLGAELGSIDDLRIVAGDFNFTPWTFALNRFERAARMVRHDGIAGTWRVSSYYPAMFPIDHIFASPEFRLTAITRGPRTGSDHLPLIATFELP